MNLKQINIKIDKLTRSVENPFTGESFKTEVQQVSAKDIRMLKKSNWLFDWKSELNDKNKIVCKLLITSMPETVQGLISLQDKGDHIYMHLIESNKFNRGPKKVYWGVPANLVAYACKLSMEYGYEGYVSFESKTKLISHYSKTLGASLLFGNIMAIDRNAAAKLIYQYFQEKM